MHKELLIIFTKNPELGKVKSRLAATIGDENALKVYLHLLDYTKSITNPLQVDKVVFYSNRVPENDAWSAAGYGQYLQEGVDLGERMQRAFQKGFNDGYTSIVIIGSDCAEVTTELLSNAFERLQNSDVVIGPSKDGGYYLLGMRKLHEKLFTNKSWSTSALMNETKVTLKELQLNTSYLPVLNDVDEEADLGRLKELVLNR